MSSQLYLATASFQAVVESEKVPPEPLFLQAEHPSCSSCTRSHRSRNQGDFGQGAGGTESFYLLSRSSSQDPRSTGSVALAGQMHNFNRSISTLEGSTRQTWREGPGRQRFRLSNPGAGAISPGTSQLPQGTVLLRSSRASPKPEPSRRAGYRVPQGPSRGAAQAQQSRAGGSSGSPRVSPGARQARAAGLCPSGGPSGAPLIQTQPDNTARK